MTVATSPHEPFVHEALFYRSGDEYLAGTVPFILDGLAAGEPVLVAVPPANGDLLRQALNGSADGVRILDMTQAGRNPGRIIPGVLNAFVSGHSPGRVRIIGEPIWAGRSSAEYPACVQHEALINTAFTGRAATILCPYDAKALTPDVLADAERTHPILVDEHGRRGSDEYVGAEVVVAAFNQPLAEPAGAMVSLPFDIDSLAALRQFVADHAVRVGLAADRVCDLQLAVNELATNSVTHANGPGVLRLWVQPDRVICEVSDAGLLTDPLAGRIPPPDDSEHGRGLILINHVCDLVQTYVGSHGTTIRVHAIR